MTGKLKGVIAATTPSGARSVNASTLFDTLGVIMPARWTGRPHAKSMVSMPRRTSARASGKVLPWSRVMSAASSSRCSYMRLRNAKKMLLRAMSGMSRQAGNAAVGGFDRLVDLGLAAARHACDHLAGRRVGDGPGLLGQDLDGRAVDVVGQDRQDRRLLRTLDGHGAPFMLWACDAPLLWQRGPLVALLGGLATFDSDQVEQGRVGPISTGRHRLGLVRGADHEARTSLRAQLASLDEIAQDRGARRTCPGIPPRARGRRRDRRRVRPCPRSRRARRTAGGTRTCHGPPCRPSPRTRGPPPRSQRPLEQRVLEPVAHEPRLVSDPGG